MIGNLLVISLFVLAFLGTTAGVGSHLIFLKLGRPAPIHPAVIGVAVAAIGGMAIICTGLLFLTVGHTRLI